MEKDKKNLFSPMTKEEIEETEKAASLALFHADQKLKNLEEPIQGESAQKLYFMVKRIFTKLSGWALFDDYKDESLVSEIKWYLSEGQCGDFKETQVQDSTGFIHCRSGLEIVFSVGKDMVFFKGFSGTKVEERTVPRQMGRTMAESMIAINELVEELGK